MLWLFDKIKIKKDKNRFMIKSLLILVKVKVFYNMCDWQCIVASFI